MKKAMFAFTVLVLLFATAACGSVDPEHPRRMWFEPRFKVPNILIEGIAFYTETYLETSPTFGNQMAEAVSVTLGPRTVPGFAVKIRDLFDEGDNLHVVVDVTSPSPDEAVMKVAPYVPQDSVRVRGHDLLPVRLTVANGHLTGKFYESLVYVEKFDRAEAAARYFAKSYGYTGDVVKRDAGFSGGNLAVFEIRTPSGAPYLMTLVKRSDEDFWVVESIEPEGADPAGG